MSNIRHHELPIQKHNYYLDINRRVHIYVCCQFCFLDCIFFNYFRATFISKPCLLWLLHKKYPSSSQAPLPHKCLTLQVTCLQLLAHFLWYGYDTFRYISSLLWFTFLDDGSSSCFCWANSNRAAALLRLHEKLPQTTSARSGWTLNCAGKDGNACSSTICRLESIFKNHDRITVKNYGSMFDSSCQDLVVSTSPASAALSISDENILKSIILNASFGTSWVSLNCLWNGL